MVAPIAFEYVPIGHAGQIVLEAEALKVPAWQSVQLAVCIHLHESHRGRYCVYISAYTRTQSATTPKMGSARKKQERDRHTEGSQTQAAQQTHTPSLSIQESHPSTT